MRNKLCGYSLFIYRMLAVTSFLCSSDSLIKMESVSRRSLAVQIPAPPPLLPPGAGAALPALALAGLAFQFSPSSLTDFFVRSQKIQILVALVQCIPLSEKLCNYCDIFYLIYFLLKCIACDSETLDYFITVIDFQLL